MNVSAGETNTPRTENTNSRLVSYPKIALKNYELQPHSYLYSLAPIGVGTPYVESLTSYVLRLAEAHNVGVGSLYSHELANRFNSPDLLDEAPKKAPRTKFITEFYSTIHAINGLNKFATDWVGLLEKLTLQSNLKYLTMLPWQNILSRKYLQKHERAWCSHCFAESRERGEVIYEQLLWTIRDVNFCIKHFTPLITNCFYCNEQSYVLTCHSRSGHCYRCKKWLGTTSSVEYKDTSQFYEVDSILCRQITAKHRFTNPRKTDSKKKHDLATIEQVLKLALKKKFPPTLNSIAEQLGYKAGSLIKQRCPELSKRVVSRRSNYLMNKKKNIEKSLIAALEETPPQSLTQIAQKLGYSNAGFPRQCFPKLCSAISKRFLEYKPKQQIISTALETALIQSPPPSINSIAKSLKTARSLLYKNNSDLCQKISARHLTFTQRVALKKNS